MTTSYDYEERSILTSRGPVAARCYWPRQDEVAAGVIFVGGVGGGFDTPARGLYPRLCEELSADSVACLRVRFRHSTLLGESIHDVRAGIGSLAGRGVARFALVGHSFGGAVVVGAAVQEPRVRMVVTLATQGAGLDDIDLLGPRCALYAIHGTEDEILSPHCSVFAYQRAKEPRELLLLPGARHVLDEAADEVHAATLAWLSRLKDPQALQDDRSAPGPG